MPANRKDDVRNWLKDLTDDDDGFPEARYVLSSRPHAAKEGWLEPEGFLDAELQDMSSADITSFIAHWHDAAREGLKDPEKIKELNQLEEALSHRIQKSPAIYKLATSPLLCAVICALHRDRMQNIPEDRIELYEACIDMFFRRDHERRIELPQYPRLSSRQIEALLSDLAYWYIRNGVSLADVKDVDERFQKKLRDFKALPEGTNGASVRMGFVARSGILREPSTGKVDFPHRTFQEFLAAKEIVDQRDFGVLIKNAEDHQNWRETIILAVGQANQHEAEHLISELLARFDKQSDVGVLLLAVGCMETSVAIADQVKQMVEERLQKVVPPKNFTEAKALSRAGDLVVPYLTSGIMKSPEAQATVRVLVMIGTAPAMAGLREMAARETRTGVWREIAAGLERSPDPFGYFAEVIEPLAGIFRTNTSADTDRITMYPIGSGASTVPVGNYGLPRLPVLEMEAMLTSRGWSYTEGSPHPHRHDDRIWVPPAARNRPI